MPFNCGQISDLRIFSTWNKNSNLGSTWKNAFLCNVVTLGDNALFAAVDKLNQLPSLHHFIQLFHWKHWTLNFFHGNIVLIILVMTWSKKLWKNYTVCKTDLDDFFFGCGKGTTRHPEWFSYQLQSCTFWWCRLGTVSEVTVWDILGDVRVVTTTDLWTFKVRKGLI